jgi:hypothetical protein
VQIGGQMRDERKPLKGRTPDSWRAPRISTARMFHKNQILFYRLKSDKKWILARAKKPKPHPESQIFRHQIYQRVSRTFSWKAKLTLLARAKNSTYTQQIYKNFQDIQQFVGLKP